MNRKKNTITIASVSFCSSILFMTIVSENIKFINRKKKKTRKQRANEKRDNEFPNVILCLFRKIFN